MEVHAHTHTDDPDMHRGRKKFTHYLWEFLMLFLAVFCGFLAENFREHQVEHLREKQYMVTMLEDLRSDTALVNDAIAYWRENNRSIDSVADAINFPLVNTDLVKVYRHLNRALDYYSFKYNDRTISQLKNAGGFRLIRKENVADKIIAYDQLNNGAWIYIKYQYNQFYENAVVLRNKAFVQEVINKIDDRTGSSHQLPYSPANNTWIDSMIHKDRSPYSISDQTVFLFEFKNALLSFRKDFSNIRWGYTELLKTQTELIKLISEEYHLK